MSGIWQDEILKQFDIDISRGDFIFVPGNVPSLKNSKIITCRGKFPSVIPSKAVQKYALETCSFWYDNYDRWLELRGDTEYPLMVCFTFVRETKRAFDFSNAVQVLEDCMSSHLYTSYKNKYVPKNLKEREDLFDRLQWIPDDNTKYFVPVFNPRVWYTKDKDSGVYITILN
jgi:hypothetical protein